MATRRSVYPIEVMSFPDGFEAAVRESLRVALVRMDLPTI
jgi:hypothetical protein